MDAAAELTLLEACWRTVVLGIVQGLTEFLPISSTAHLKVVPVLAGWGDPGVAVTAVIQLGSIAAVIGYFRRDLLQVCRGLAKALRQGDWGSSDARLGIAIAVGTAAGCGGGLLIKTVLAWLRNIAPAQRGLHRHRLDRDGLAVGPCRASGAAP